MTKQKTGNQVNPRWFEWRAGRRMAAMLATLSVLGMAGLVNAAPVHAALGDLACSGSSQIDFSPALTATNTTARVTASEAEVGCVSPNGRFPHLTSATATGTGTANATPGVNPCSVQQTFTVTGTVKWSPTGQQSTFAVLFNTNPSNGTVGIEVTITGGVLAGDKVNTVGALITNLDCAVNGLSSLILPVREDIFG